jgi:ankyrin repeat protein
MTEHQSPWLQLTQEEEAQSKLLTALRETVRAVFANQPQAGQAPCPAYMADAVMITKLEHWASGHYLGELKQALLSGVDVNATDERGVTALHYAVRAANIRAVQLLINAGADLQAKSPAGEAPLDWAIAAKENALVRLLKNQLFICLHCDVAVIRANESEHRCKTESH